MGDSSNRSLRIDWFDGTVIEESRPNTSSGASRFSDEDQQQPQTTYKAKYTGTDNKPIGFKRLHDFSLLKPPILNLEIAHRPGFWNLLDAKLKGDFIVLIVRILANIFKSLEPGDDSKIAGLLRTKFEKSNFLEVLKEYLTGLPSVRVVSKRMNSHLWDDVQSFYFEVVSLCEGIVNFSGNSADAKYLKSVYDLLNTTETSALGVIQEHTETFSDSLFERIVALEDKIKPPEKTFADHLFKQIGQLPSRLMEFVTMNQEDTATEPMNCQSNLRTRKIQEPESVVRDDSFKYLSIFPSKEDLLQESCNVKIKPNIVDGAYPSVEQYLDLQFKLLREDCFGPLREGICKYMENPSKRRHDNIRVYPKVRVIHTHITNNKVGHLVDIAWGERVARGTVDCREYADNKQLMFGSLLLFTSDHFDTILCATVLDSNVNLLKEGYVAVSFQNPLSENIFSKRYLMVESEVFFEPYHRVLKVMQNSSLDDLPMKKYIVNVQNGTHSPAYLTQDSVYTVQNVAKTGEIPFRVLEPFSWPPSSIGLDESQLEAYTFALTREFAVIQGPPGTGKTFIGVKIASTLLRNLSLEGTPMLIICYTNHALDQFLEGILNVTTNIVRLGRQSKSKVLEPYSLYNVRSRVKSKYSRIYAMKRSELETVYREMVDLQTEIMKCEKEILSHKCLAPFLKGLICKSGKGDPVLSWLFEHLDDTMESSIDDDDWKKQAETFINDTLKDQINDLSVRTTLDTSFSEQWALKEIDSMTKSIKYAMEMIVDHSESQAMIDKFQNNLNKVRKRLDYFKKQLALVQLEDKQANTGVQTRYLHRLSPNERWAAYFTAVRSVKSQLMIKMNKLMEKHKKCSAELSEVATLTDGEVLKPARVVGVTTTTAASRHDLMKMLRSPIVIVEEAAEVLEAHIVASLTHHCRHVILIGDHKQLRPTAAHYKLAKHYNLEISLFERMVRNGVHARTLTTQRRMRPTFMRLLVPTVYETLTAHPSVYKYADVRGMKDNLYFCTHQVFEDTEGMEDSWSHKHTLEAKWCVSLANYLRLMLYAPEDITILTTYTVQASLIEQLSKKYELLRDVKITSVDSYQGEENRIVILSLVRSNKEGSIGFLKETNRVCVALSRAKEGFYIFGNMNILKWASTIWRSINDKLVEQNAIGNRLTLRCKHEDEGTLEVGTTEELDNSFKGPCLRTCKDADKNTETCKDTDKNTRTCKDADKNTWASKDADKNSPTCKDADINTRTCKDADKNTRACKDADKNLPTCKDADKNTRTCKDANKNTRTCDVDTDKRKCNIS